MAKNNNNNNQELDWYDEFDPFAELDEGAKDFGSLPRIKNGGQPHQKQCYRSETNTMPRHT